MRSIVLITVILLAGCHTVEPGHVGVQSWFGAIQEETLPEGFNYITPFMDVEDMSIQTQNMTMEGNQALHAMSSDQLSMEIHVTLLYHLNEKAAPGIRRLMPNYQQDVVLPSIRVASRDAIRDFDAVSAVSTKRDLVGERVAELVKIRLANAMKQRELPETAIIVDDVQLRDIRLPPELRDSISRVQKQRQAGHEREQAIETARQEALRQGIEAEGRAKVNTIKANNAAEVRMIAARAEASANETIAKSLTPAILRIREIEAQRSVLSSEQTRTIFIPFGEKSPNVMMNIQ